MFLALRFLKYPLALTTSRHLCIQGHSQSDFKVLMRCMMSPKKQHRTIVPAAVWVLEKLLEVNSFKIETLLNFTVHFSPRTSAGAAPYKQDHYYLRMGQKHCTFI